MVPTYDCTSDWKCKRIQSRSLIGFGLRQLGRVQPYCAKIVARAPAGLVLTLGALKSGEDARLRRQIADQAPRGGRQIDDRLNVGGLAVEVASNLTQMRHASSRHRCR